MTFQMVNYYKHTRSFSLSALSEEAVALWCLDSLLAAVTSTVSSVGRQGVGACLPTYVCVCEQALYRRAHSCTCLLLHHRHWTRALRKPLVLVIVVKVVQQSDLYDSCWWNSCQDCFAESLFLLVDLFQQTPNTTESLSLHLWGWWVLPASMWAWDGNKRQNKLCNDTEFLRWIFLFSATPAHACSWVELCSLTSYFLSS